MQAIMFGHIIIHQSVYNYGSFGLGLGDVHCLRMAVSCEVDVLPCHADIDKVIIEAIFLELLPDFVKIFILEISTWHTTPAT